MMNTIEKKRILLVLVLAMLIIVGVGCGNMNESTNDNSNWNNSGYDHASNEASDGEGSPGIGYSRDAASPQEELARAEANQQEIGMQDDFEFVERKIIRERFIHQQVQDLSQVLRDLQRSIDQIPGAYIQSLNEHTTEGRNRNEKYAYMTVRIPVDDWPTFEKLVKEQGNIISHEISGQDVTEEFVDNESRLRNLRAHEERILDLYEKADTIEDMLKIEGELSRIRSSIEQLDGRQQYLGQVTSTIKLSLELFEVEDHEYVSGQEDQSLWKEATLGFKKSIDHLTHLVQRFSVWFISVFPYLLIITLIAGLITAILIYRIRKKRHNKLDNSNTSE